MVGTRGDVNFGRLRCEHQVGPGVSHSAQIAELQVGISASGFGLYLAAEDLLGNLAS